MSDNPRRGGDPAPAFTAPDQSPTLREKNGARERGEGSWASWVSADVRRCVRCRELKPASAFRVNRQLKCGLDSWCSACKVEDTREWRAENPERVAAYNASRRLGPFPMVCVDCGELFEARRRDQVRCPACQAERRREADRLKKKRRRRGSA